MRTVFSNGKKALESIIWFLKKFFHSWVDFLFPPLCAVCKEPSQGSMFCSECWEHCSLPDPESRCGHCFEEEERELCGKCRAAPSLPYPFAYVFERNFPVLKLCSMQNEDPDILASFAFVQWERLNRPFPEVIIPLPRASAAGKALAERMSCPCFDVFFEFQGKWNCRSIPWEQGASILLLCFDHGLTDVAAVIHALYESAPKKIFILNLIRPTESKVIGEKKYDCRFDLCC